MVFFLFVFFVEVLHKICWYNTTFLLNKIFILLYRSTIRNPQSIHTKGRQRISQDSYRRQSRKYLQQRGRLPSQPRKNSRSTAEKNPGEFLLDRFIFLKAFYYFTSNPFSPSVSSHFKCFNCICYMCV